MAAEEPDSKLPWRLIVFDCDGTLVDSQHSIVAAMQAAFKAAALPLPAAEFVRRVVGLSLEQAVERILELMEAQGHLSIRVSGLGAEQIAEHYRKAFHLDGAAKHREVPLYPGARQALAELDKRRVLLGVATGKGRRGLSATLEAHGLSQLFVTLQTADVAPSKPHPEMLHRAMAEAGAEPEETLVIGDTVFDMEMAANARVGAIGVSWGYHAAEELAGYGALRVLNHFNELMPALFQLAFGLKRNRDEGD